MQATSSSRQLVYVSSRQSCPPGTLTLPLLTYRRLDMPSSPLRGTRCPLGYPCLAPLSTPPCCCCSRLTPVLAGEQNRQGSKGRRSTHEASPSSINSLMAFPVTGAHRMPALAIGKVQPHARAVHTEVKNPWQ